MKAAATFVLFASFLLPRNVVQRQPYTLSVDVDLVVLNIRVLDRNGESVHGLPKEAFEVQENGTHQDISLFIGQDSPATIGLVLDSSASMNSKYSEVKAAALRFIQSTRPRDEIFVLHFNDRLHWPFPHTDAFTDDVHRLEWAVASNGLGGRTALYDAVASALHQCERGRAEKRALIVLSDGGDNASMETLEGVLRLAQQSNVTIYTIGLFDPLASDSSWPVLQNLARLTGGDAFLPRSVEQLAPVWEEITHGIRTQYTIGYRPSQTMFDGKFHKVRVRVKTPDHSKVRVHTRPGYLARTARLEP